MFGLAVLVTSSSSVNESAMKAARSGSEFSSMT